MYSRNKTRADGLQNKCKDCFSVYKKRWDEVHKENKSIYSKRYYKTNPGLLRKNNAKRRGYKDAIPLIDNPFEEEVHYHHIDDYHVVAVPKDIHNCYTGHKYTRKMHQDILQPIIEDLYSISFEELLS